MLRSDASVYHDGSSHLDHMSDANLAVAVIALAAALVLAAAGYFGYTTPG